MKPRQQFSWAALLITAVSAPLAVADESYLQRQARRQDENRKIAPLRTPNFRPFEAELKSKHDRLGTLTPKLEKATISQLQALLGSGQLTSAELTLWYVSRIRTYDVDKFRSVLELNPDALIDANQCDAKRQELGSAHGPLYGLPILLKDNIATAGRLHTTAGAAALLNAKPDRDAFIVRRLRDAGAIVLGKTNLTEWANFMTNNSVNGFSAVGGQTLNPFGKFEVGGSSAGSAVAAACHFAAATIGSETYGSIVYPASFNAVVGLKPTVGLVSRDRIIPITAATDTAGPLARSCADAAAVMSVIAAADPNDPDASATAAPKPVDFVVGLTDRFLQGKKIAVLVSGAPIPGDESIRTRVLETLQSSGAIVESIEFKRRGYPFGKMFQCGFKNGVDAYLKETKAPFPTLQSIVQYNAADMAARAPFGQKTLEDSVRQTLSLEEYRKLVADNRTSARDALEPIFASHDLIVSFEYSGMHGGVFPMAGVPALCLPAGRRTNGEPVGFLFVARRFEDVKVLAAGADFEKQAAMSQSGAANGGPNLNAPNLGR